MRGPGKPTAEALIVDLVTALAVEAHLGQAGLSGEDVTTLRDRLVVGQPVTPA